LGYPENHINGAYDALSVIKISNTLLRSNFKSVEPKFVNALTMIEKSTSKIERFLRSIKMQTHSAEQSGDNSEKFTKLKKTKFLLSELLKVAIPKNHSKTLRINIPKNDLEIFGNFYKLVVVLSNLFENAIQAMENKGTINIFGRDVLDSSIIEIQDTGPGIPSKNLGGVFSSLYTTKQDGSGLGLKMAKTIIDMHRGSISVSNNPTTFTIKIPKTNH